MEKYTVVWAKDVQAEFIDQWIRAESAARDRLTNLANTIDRLLAISPDSRGELLPSEPGSRVWVFSEVNSLVSVVFEIIPDDCITRILRITIHSS